MANSTAISRTYAPTIASQSPASHGQALAVAGDCSVDLPWLASPRSPSEAAERTRLRALCRRAQRSTTCVACSTSPESRCLPLDCLRPHRGQLCVVRSYLHLTSSNGLRGKHSKGPRVTRVDLTVNSATLSPRAERVRCMLFDRPPMAPCSRLDAIVGCLFDMDAYPMSYPPQQTPRRRGCRVHMARACIPFRGRVRAFASPGRGRANEEVST